MRHRQTDGHLKRERLKDGKWPENTTEASALELG